jgi:hypothetical protein
MKGNPKAVPVCILSVELRKLEVCDFGRFRFRIHLNPQKYCDVEEVHLEKNQEETNAVENLGVGPAALAEHWWPEPNLKPRKTQRSPL